MRNSIFLIPIIFLLSLTKTTAQDYKKHELGLGIGVWSTSNIVFGFADAFAGSLLVGDREFRNRSSSPVVHVGYKHWIGKRFGIGLTFATGTGSSQLYDNNVLVGNVNRFYTTIAAESVFNYVNKDFFKVYALLGGGALFINQKYSPVNGSNNRETNVNFDFQITPVGAKIGRNIGFYAELGFGYKGIISSGLFIKI